MQLYIRKMPFFIPDSIFRQNACLTYLAFFQRLYSQFYFQTRQQSAPKIRKQCHLGQPHSLRLVCNFKRKSYIHFLFSLFSHFKPIVDIQVLQFNSLKGLLNTLKKRQTYFIYSQCFQKHLMRQPELSSSSGWLSKYILHLCDVCTLLVTKTFKKGIHS